MPLAVVAILGIGFVVLKFHHSGGDPGGSILNSLRSQVRSAVPAGATITGSHSAEPVWNSRGCDGSTGWTEPSYGLTFRSNDPPLAVIAFTNHVLTSEGWQHVSVPNYREINDVWIKTPSGSATISLQSGQGATAAPGKWSLGGDLPTVKLSKAVECPTDPAVGVTWLDRMLSS